jgi:lipoate-protein ligase A
MVVQALQGLEMTVPKQLLSEGQWSDFPKVRVSDRNDIVMQRPNEAEWLKVSGSAYKLTKGRALHHGTLLYSSPYIHHISGLLRSPGRDFITAHGVESVRSKVGNLAYTASQLLRNNIRKDITEAIVRQFWAMYGNGQAREHGTSEITLAAPTSFDELEEQNPWLAKGVQELMSPAWIFEQTPKFDFKSGMLENHEVDLHADKGALKSLSLRGPVPGSADSPDGLVWRQRRKDFGNTEAHHSARDGEEKVKLHQVKDWKGLLANTSSADSQTHERTPEPGEHAEAEGEHTMAHVPDVLVQRLEAIFPAYRAVRKSGIS